MPYSEQGQIGIVNDPMAGKLSRPVTAIIGAFETISSSTIGRSRVLKLSLAGAAPTAHIIAELEKKGINPVHVYGLTCVSLFILWYNYLTFVDHILKRGEPEQPA